MAVMDGLKVLPDQLPRPNFKIAPVDFTLEKEQCHLGSNNLLMERPE